MSYLPLCRSLMFVAAAIVAASFAPRARPKRRRLRHLLRRRPRTPCTATGFSRPWASRSPSARPRRSSGPSNWPTGCRTGCGPPTCPPSVWSWHALKKRLDDANRPDNHSQVPAPARRADAAPNWIWYPEGKPAEDAPAAARFFRCRFEVPVRGPAGRTAHRGRRCLRGYSERRPRGRPRYLAASGRLFRRETAQAGPERAGRARRRTGRRRPRTRPA